MALARRVAAAALAAALALGLARAGGAQDDDRARELEAVREAIQERRERVAAFERRERGLLETLEAMEQAALDLGARAARARERARAAREELGSLEGREGVLEARQQETQRAMARRAVALYKAGDAGPVRILFSATSLPEMLARSRVLRVLLEHDRELIERYRAGTADLTETRARLAAVAAEQEHALALAGAQAAELAAERRAKRVLARQVREDRARERAALVELEAAAVALEETLARLRRRAPTPGAPAPGAPFASLRGFLYPPVTAPIDRGFGRVVDAEFRTETFRKGVDFAAEAGTPVLAVAAGEVRFAGWFRGYGRMVILDHGDQYFTISAHLNEVDVEAGDPVAPGDRLGTVGDTGSLTGPRLYFEIRRGAEPQDPAGWLRPDSQS